MRFSRGVVSTTCHESGGKDLRTQNLAANWHIWYAVWIYER